MCPHSGGGVNVHCETASHLACECISCGGCWMEQMPVSIVLQLNIIARSLFSPHKSVILEISLFYALF